MYLKSLYYALLTILGVATSVLVGCGTIGADSAASRINVEFEDSVQSLQRGDQVYMLGLPVGEVGKPFLRNNRATVPVSLADSRVFGEHDQVFFFIAPDQAKPGHHCLNAVIHPVTAEAGKPRFRGFASKMGLDLQMGTDRVKSWWKGVEQDLTWQEGGHAR
jgi:hypothetical protein